MIRLFERICCAIGMHAWWYEPRKVPPYIALGAPWVMVIRICSSCPAKEKLVVTGSRQRWAAAT